jgi:arylsulfatase A-like enzyme/Tfp pilus assembly protein PilF
MLCVRGAPAATPAAVNVLVVTIDTLRVDRVGAYGSRAGLTPAMDALAKEGVVFEQATVPVPLTRPSHVSLLTGKLPFQHGIRDNFSFSLGASHRTLAELLKAKGYATGGFVGAFMLNAQSGLDRGFDEFDDSFEERGGQSAFLAEHQRVAGEVEQRAGAWIERVARREAPFFAWVHFYDPHSPYDPPPPYRARYAGRPYDGEVAYTDSVLGRLLARLDRLGLQGRTLVVVTSDHGEGLGDHGEAEHGFFLYETTVRVPLIIRLPGGLPAGLRIPSEARSIDVLPTVLELVGASAAAPPGIPGRSVAAALSGPAGATPPSYAETLFPRLHFECAELRSIRFDGWKYVEAPRPELYDLRADPNERSNLYAREGRRAASLRSRLLDTMGGSLEAAIVAKPGAAPDAETQRKLASLGYVSGSSGSAGADPKDAIAAFQAYTRSVRGAFESYDRGDLRAAVAGFESAVAGGRAGFDVHYYLGAAYLKLGQAERAVGPLQEAIRRNASYTPATIELATAYLRLNKADEATAVLRAALANDAGSFQLHSHLGYVARLRRDLALARQEYETARNLNPRDFDVRMNLSSVYRDAGDAKRALEEVDAALAMRQDSADAYNQRGMLLGGAGRFAEAAVAFERAATLAPKNSQFWFNLGLARYRAGNRPGAADALRKAIALKPDFAEAKALLTQVSGQ